MYTAKYYLRCFLCIVLLFDGLLERPKHVAAVIYIVKILLFSVGENGMCVIQ